MRHEDPTINSILNADVELLELEHALFVSLWQFYETYDNRHSAESLNLAARDVKTTKSEYNLALAQASGMLEQAFDYLSHGRTCDRACCVTDAHSAEVVVTFDPLGVMNKDTMF